jgi:hypothetical protein
MSKTYLSLATTSAELNVFFTSLKLRQSADLVWSYHLTKTASAPGCFSANSLRNALEMMTMGKRFLQQANIEYFSGY